MTPFVRQIKCLTKGVIFMEKNREYGMINLLSI